MPTTDAERERLESLACRVRYVGNPDHKRDPGDYGLDPPSRPRPGKSLCDVVAVFSRTEAQALLEKGIRDGLVCDQDDNGWPRVVWAIRDDDILEARLDNAEQGTYHGYPLDPKDPFCAMIRDRLKAS